MSISNYSSGMSHAHAKHIIEQGKLIQGYQFPDDIEKLNELLLNLHIYLENNLLKNTELYTDLSNQKKNITYLVKYYKNLSLVGNSPSLKDLFDHIKEVIKINQLKIAQEHNIKL